MYISSRTFIKPGMRLFDLIEENQSLLLMMQHFNIDFRIADLTVSQICEKNNINETIFIAIANLYNGYKPKINPIDSIEDLKQVIVFLKNCHNYYRGDKYPQISIYIQQLQERHSEKELKLLEHFFDEYFTEVLEHLDYEENIAFPYFVEILSKASSTSQDFYSAKEYMEHHTDIELKLKDLKNLLLKYVEIDNDLSLRRKLLFELFELEYDLYIHSLIEETILVPFGYTIEEEK